MGPADVRRVYSIKLTSDEFPSFLSAIVASVKKKKIQFVILLIVCVMLNIFGFSISVVRLHWLCGIKLILGSVNHASHSILPLELQTCIKFE